jgi:tRNA threonylcarbamoyl adenosine modification protein YeaZ
MVVLALDTCTEQGSVAVGRDGRLLEARALPAGWRSTTLHLEIARLLQQQGLATKDIDGYGVTSGPGSFTGVRLGMSAVKGLAEVHRKPIVPVSTLETVASAAVLSFPRPQLLAPLLDARRGQVFGGVYRLSDGRLRAVMEETVSSLASFLKRLTMQNVASAANSGSGSGLDPRGGIAFCGIDVAPFVSELEAAGWGAPRVSVPPCLARPLLEIATERIQEGLGVDASLAEANYVRLSDAELFWKQLP